MMTGLLVLFSGCCTPVEPELEPLDAGFAGRVISGTVTDRTGSPVPETRVVGTHTMIRDGVCQGAFPSIRPTVTDSIGKYVTWLSESVIVGSHGDRCVVFEFFPPEDSGLLPAVTDTLRALAYSNQASARRDTFYVNMVLDSR